ncbi:hypothetical protein BB561_004359 [Smittium simulii]|uniref:Uncharacterized protein n=1 Tax=Smittium simulii TaxID=133385 RepID=A0A2T9YGR1_9FUNG|nr:hypothetical protein BB561_004359 [Smittium simulii]
MIHQQHSFCPICKTPLGEYKLDLNVLFIMCPSLNCTYPFKSHEFSSNITRLPDKPGLSFYLKNSLSTTKKVYPRLNNSKRLIKKKDNSTFLISGSAKTSILSHSPVMDCKLNSIATKVPILPHNSHLKPKLNPLAATHQPARYNVDKTASSTIQPVSTLANIGTSASRSTTCSYNPSLHSSNSTSFSISLLLPSSSHSQHLPSTHNSSYTTLQNTNSSELADTNTSSSILSSHSDITSTLPQDSLSCFMTSIDEIMNSSKITASNTDNEPMFSKSLSSTTLFLENEISFSKFSPCESEPESTQTLVSKETDIKCLFNFDQNLNSDHSAEPDYDFEQELEKIISSSNPQNINSDNNLGLDYDLEQELEKIVSSTITKNHNSDRNVELDFDFEKELEKIMLSSNTQNLDLDLSAPSADNLLDSLFTNTNNSNNTSYLT